VGQQNKLEQLVNKSGARRPVGKNKYKWKYKYKWQTQPSGNVQIDGKLKKKEKNVAKQKEFLLQETSS